MQIPLFGTVLAFHQFLSCPPIDPFGGGSTQGRLTLKTIQKLQLLQNVAIQAMKGMPQYTDVKPLLHKLHWWPDCFWVCFKVLVTTNKPYMSQDLVT